MLWNITMATTNPISLLEPGPKREQREEVVWTLRFQALPTARGVFCTWLSETGLLARITPQCASYSGTTELFFFGFRILHDIHLANSGRKNPDVFALIWSSRNDKLPSSPYTRSTHEKRKSKRVVKMSFKKINILLQPKSPHILAIKSFTLLL